MPSDESRYPMDWLLMVEEDLEMEQSESPTDSSAEVVERMVSRILEHVCPERIILFGSHARGKASAHSDFDLLIIAPSDKPRWQRTVPIYQLLAGLGVPKDIVWWTPDEVAQWRGVKSHFINTVLREGKVVYEKPS